MSAPTVREVLAQLEAEGVLPREPTRAEAAHQALADAAARDREGAPWFVRVLVGAGSLVAVGLLLAFLFAVDLVDRAEGALAVGGVLVAVALAVRRAGRGDLVGPAALTVGLAGELLVIGGAGLHQKSLVVGAATALALEAALLALVPDRIHRVLSTVGMATALTVLLLDEAPLWTLDVLAVALAAGLHALLLLRPRLEAGRHHGLVGPAAAGLAASLFGLLVLGLSLEARAGEALPPLGPLATVGLAAVALGSSLAMAREHAGPAGGRALWVLRGALVLLAALTLRTPGLLAALGVAGLAFHRRDRVLLGLAALFVLAFGTASYYQLSLSLLAKSGVLVGSGAVLLLSRAALGRQASPAPSVEVRP